MAKFQIQVVPGLTYKAIQRGTNGQVWNPAPSSGPPLFETYNGAHIVQYEVATSAPDALGWISGDFSPGIPDQDELTVQAFAIAGAHLAESDAPPLGGQTGKFTSGDWDHSSAAPTPEAGNGDIPVDHNYGGTDELLIEDNLGDPADNAIIRAYTATAFATGAFSTNPPTSYSGSDGRWIRPLMLDPDDYKLTVYNPLTEVTDVFDLTVEAP